MTDQVKPKLYSLNDSGHVLGDTSPWTLRAHIRAGNIRVTRLGNRVFISAEELDRVAREGLPSLGAPRPASETFKVA